MKEKYADIIVDISHEKLDRSFQYLIPDQLQGQLLPGMQVMIPFGNGNRTTRGYVVSVGDEAAYDPQKMKQILEIPAGSTTIESRLIALASWIRDNYGSTMIQALKTVLPIKEKAKHKELKKICRNVEVSVLEVKYQEAMHRHYTAKARLLALLMDQAELDYAEVTGRYKVSTAVIRKFEEQGIIRIQRQEVYRKPFGEIEPGADEGVMTVGQLAAVQGILAEWSKETPRTCLVHGVTGSGKTLLYMELIQSVIDQGQQAIVLIPEIALTWQTVMRFYQRFGDQIAVINSRMSHGERSDSFEQAKRGAVQVMIGPRSALFTPFPDLGLIIIDEEHENTYKSEGVPRYHARETAIARGRIEDARVVLGSATPSVDAYYRCENGEYALFTLTERFGAGNLPAVYTVDLREELKMGNHSILSRQLQEGIARRLQRNEQVMLFLNRRGYAGFVACRSCGHVVKCPHCDISLSIHNHGRMLCHYCGYETAAVSKCPECQSPYIGGFRAGTQQIEEIVKQQFPGARVLRMDMDTTQKKDGHARILSAFARREADILIGTQMIVKGHDFPRVTLVGVLAADLSLFADDYRAAERTFQLVTQAVGRAGRGDQAGEAVIQTYQPDHYCIEAARTQDYEMFYQQEIAYRLLMEYPPTAQMMAILANSEDEDQLKMAMEFLKRYIEKLDKLEELKVIGPAAATVARVNDRYRMVLYIKHHQYLRLTKLRDALEDYIEINSGFQKIAIQFDFNM